MDIKEKVKIFESSCQRLLRKEVSELNKTIDAEIEKQIKDELQEYQEREEFAYNKKIENLEKEYNKQIYSLEMDSKKEILNQKKIIQKDLKNEIIQLLKDFTKTQEYKSFLMSRIEETIQKLDNPTGSVLSLVPLDNEKYGDEIRSKYNVNIQIIDDKYIGGCILEDKVAGVYIDNTIQNSINEKIGE